MSMTDPISDMLTRLRNAQRVGKARVRMPASKVKESIAEVLQREGYIDGYQAIDLENNKRDLELTLRYFEGRPVIERIERASRPGLRMYRGKTELPKVDGGLGVAIISTSQGLMSDRAARKNGHGGEVLCYVS